MELESRRRIEETVVDILRTTSLDEMTEFKVRVAASERLGIDLSGVDRKSFVRGVVESFLISAAAEAEPPSVREGQEAARLKKEANEDGERVICKLTNRRNVVIHDFRGKTLVSIREFYKKGGKELPSARGISLPAEQWTTFKNSVPAIEEAIKKMESKLRSEIDSKRTEDGKETEDGKQTEDGKETEDGKQVEDGKRTEGSKQTEDGKQAEDGKQSEASKRIEDGEQNGDGKQTEDARQSEDMSASLNDVAPHEFFSIETCRYNGKNYPIWAQQMEFLLKQLKIAYVLFVSCPVITLGPEPSTEEIAQAKAAEQQWRNDDSVCRRSILNALSDDLLNLYSRRTTTAKELWEDLKQLHLYEKFGTKRSLVKKYMEFQMLEGRPVLEQIQEFNNIADSIVASGMVVEEKFHVSVVISKLPPSWKDVSIKLMSEEHLPFANMMDRLRFEENLRTREQQGLPINHAGNPPVKLIPRMRDMKQRNMQWKRSDLEIDGRVICQFCGKKGHISQNCRYNNKRKFTKDVNDESHDGSMPMEVNMLEETLDG
ncbi:putative transcription factor ssDNA-binding-TF family [Rosa chinensis]|uniref:Putative transcription factor ssDNA-binding-TF family n=1 Tax=Rosa chinensis TaxID=74649 RepID=A0A2P6SIK7_ROSCH|nr:uncharacterized protein LOC112182027 isoform X1 [Rosa chinensis]PRQ58500.1 putative transcription factor ssDNA-binding-TF family [Rosa chinensis]